MKEILKIVAVSAAVSATITVAKAALVKLALRKKKNEGEKPELTV